MTGKNLKKAWDRQWRGPILSTCAQFMDAEAGKAQGGAWAAFFGDLPAGAKILDLGTGNGLLPLIALRVSEVGNKSFDIHGADYADIDPAKALPDQAEHLNKIHFHPKTPTENLGFPDQTFDAVTAQHAFEYGDLEKSAAEVARVLKKGGKIRFLVHAAESEIIRANFCKIEQARYILEDAGLFTLTRRAVETGAGETLRAALTKTAEKFKSDPNTGDLLHLLELLWGAFEQRDKFKDDAAFRRWAAENEAELAAQKLRIEALTRAALDKGGIEGLVKIFAALGVTLTPSPVTAKNGGQVGWLLGGQK